MGAGDDDDIRIRVPESQVQRASKSKLPGLICTISAPAACAIATVLSVEPESTPGSPATALMLCEAIPSAIFQCVFLRYKPE
jgi:hypothetical protein